MQSCLVVLAFYAKVEEDGKERIIPIWTNHFRNSRLGVKALRLKLGIENKETNEAEAERLTKEMEEAKTNPYIHKIDESRSVEISYLGFFTMVFTHNSH